MIIQDIPIGNVVSKCGTWNPQQQGTGTFDYIALSSVDKDTKSIVSVERCSCSDAPSRARQLVETGDVLVATVRPNLNGVALVGEEYDRMTASTGYCVLRPKRDKLSSAFLFHWVKTNSFVKRMVQVATGANYPAVSDAKVKASFIPLPPLTEQKRIAGILDAADALRAKRRDSLAQLDALLQSTFLTLFGDPVSGNECLFSDLAVPGRGTFSNGPFGSDLLTSELTNNGVPVVYIRDIRDSEYVRVSKVCVTEEKGKALDACQILAGDILIAKVGDPPGTAAIYPAGEPLGIITQDVIRIRPNLDLVLPEFIVGYLNSHLGRRLISRITVEATRSRFSLRDLKGLSLNLPPLDLQRRFAGIVDSIEQQKARQRAHLAELDALFDSLQHRAFNGELRAA